MNRNLRYVLWFAMTVIAVTGGAFAQEQAPKQPNPTQGLPPAQPYETRIFDVKYADVNQLAQALSVFGAQIVPSPQLHILSVRTLKDIMPAVADAIKRLDVAPTPPPQPPPAKNVELIIYVVNATDQPDNAPLPAPLQPVINQLRNVLSYKGFQVVDTQIIRGIDGRQAQTSGHMPSLPKPAAIGADSPPPSSYNFSVNSFRVRTTDKDPAVFLEGMRFGVQVPNWTEGKWNFYNVGINSDVEIPRGQQVVVGKTTIGDRALILVMSAKVVD
jgi:hypothetical protein